MHEFGEACFFDVSSSGVGSLFRICRCSVDHIEEPGISKGDPVVPALLGAGELHLIGSDFSQSPVLSSKHTRFGKLEECGVGLSRDALEEKSVLFFVSHFEQSPF